ncbi:MAG TPA: hypothetical protein VI756_14360 [Blastocatellia bacterium]
MKRNFLVMALAAAALIITAPIYGVPAINTVFPSARSVGTGPAKPGTVEQFKAAFQNDKGKVRLIALVSPT